MHDFTQFGTPVACFGTTELPSATVVSTLAGERPDLGVCLHDGKGGIFPIRDPEQRQQFWAAYREEADRSAHAAGLLVQSAIRDGIDATLNRNRPFDTVAFCVAWEAGELDEEETARGFQILIDKGTLHHLQGCYGRAASALASQGLVTFRR